MMCLHNVDSDCIRDLRSSNHARGMQQGHGHKGDSVNLMALTVAALKAALFTSDCCVQHVARILLIFLGIATCGSALAQYAGGPPENPSHYTLAWEDYFAGDSSNAGGELKNIIGSSSNPLRPDWFYRTGSLYNCPLQKSSNNVHIRTGTTLNGLVLTDIGAGSNGAGNYATYTCGGVISTRWLQYGYYETRAYIGTGTNTQGFHTSFWIDGAAPTGGTSPIAVTESDGFEIESQYADTSSGKFSHGVWYHNEKDGSMPAAHPYPLWSDLGASPTTVHYFGFLWSPTGMKYYFDGQPYPGDATTPGFASDGTLPTYGGFAPQNVWLTSVGSPRSAGDIVGPQISTTQGPNFDFTYQWFRYYQPLIAYEDVLPIPSNAILIDTTAPSTGTTNFTTTGTSWQASKTNMVQVVGGTGSEGLSNANIIYGAQGFRGQNAWVATTAGDAADWSHTFSSVDAGAYDVYIWNTTLYKYELLPLSSGNHALDSASQTIFDLSGNTGPAFPTLNINQSSSGQKWIPLNADTTKTTSTNTFLFTSGSTATVKLTVGNESSVPSGGGTFIPHTNADSVVFVPVHTLGISGLATGDSFVGTPTFYGSSLLGWANTPSSYSNNAAAYATWTATVTPNTTYAVTAWVPYLATGNSSPNAFYLISSGGSTLATVGPINQQANAAQWIQLATVIPTASTMTVTVTNGNTASGGTVTASGNLRTNTLKLTPQVSPDYYLCDNSAGLYGESLWNTTSGTWSAGGANPVTGCSGSSHNSTSAGATAVYTPEVPVQGMYRTYLYDSGIPSTSTITVTSHSASDMVCNGVTGTGNWIYLGDYFYSPGRLNNGTTTDHITLTSSTGTITTSAVKLSFTTGYQEADIAAECTHNSAP